jgi:topoisomerase-4 subunit A
MKKDLTDEQIDKLLSIPIRRTSAYDSYKTKEEIKSIEQQLKDIDSNLKDMKSYAINWIDETIKLIKQQPYDGHRQTEVASFETVTEKEVIQKNIAIKYNSETGYAGSATTGDTILTVSKIDKIMVIHNDGTWVVYPVKEFTKVHVGANALIEEANKDSFGEKREFIIIYDKAGKPYITKFYIKSWVTKKVYKPVGESKVYLFKEGNGKFELTYEPKGKQKITENFDSKKLEKGKLASRVVSSWRWIK